MSKNMRKLDELPWRDALGLERKGSWKEERLRQRKNAGSWEQVNEGDRPRLGSGGASARSQPFVSSALAILNAS